MNPRRPTPFVINKDKMKVESRFHKYAEKRVVSLAQQRRNRGLAIKGDNSGQIKPQKKKRRSSSESSEQNNKA